MCGKNITESQLRTAFGEFGTIEEVWVLKDRTSMEHKVSNVLVLLDATFLIFGAAPTYHLQFFRATFYHSLTSNHILNNTIR